MENEIARNDHDRISPTAKITAYWRSLSDIPYSKEIAKAVGAEETAREMLGDQIVMMGKISPAMFESRYKSINRGLQKRGMTNVMELACGLSPRGIEIASGGGIYVGTDLPEMYAESSPIITDIAKRTGAALDRIHFQPANVLDKDEMESAAAHFGGKPFAVCNEGLLMYLDMEEKAKMAGNVRDILLRKGEGVHRRSEEMSSFRDTGGCWITTDIMLGESRRKIAFMFGEAGKAIAKSAMQNITAQTGRDIFGNDFKSTADAVKFYNDLGFGVEEFPMYTPGQALSTASIIPEARRTEFLRILSSTNAWILTPKA